MKRILAALSLVAALALASLPSGAAPNSSSTGCSLTSVVPCTSSFSNNGIQSFVTTYKYSSLGNTPAATPTDLFTITGSATKTIRVTKIVVSGFAATTAGDLNPLIIRRSSADLTGTSTAPTPMARDIGFPTATPAATATLALYTANPGTLGTTVGTLDSCRLFLALATAVPDVCVFSYGTNDDQLTVLRGTTDILAINFAGAAVPSGGAVDLDIEWTEEPLGN